MAARLLFFKRLLACVGALAAADAVAQLGRVTLDGSAGPAGTLNGPNFAITSALGTTRGANLFHSFGEFSLSQGQKATFSNPASVSNIIARVTGPSYSTINGSVSARLEVGGAPTATLSGAHLWLLNPKGVLFGPNANLDLGGSFHVSTADYLRLGKGAGTAVFYASLGQASSLSSAAPSAFGFLASAAQPIILDGAGLVTKTGKTLSLVAGGVGLFNDAAVFAPGGRINVASVAGPGEISPAAASIEASPGMALGDVAIVDAGLRSSGLSGTAAGAVFLRGGRIELSAGGYIDASAYEGTGAAGSVTIRAGESVLIDGRSPSGFSAGLYAAGFGAGQAGAITVATPALTVSNEGRIRAATAGSGAGGAIDLQANRIALLSGGQVDAGSYGAGAGGSVRVTAQESLAIDGSGGAVFTGILAHAKGTGAGGTISVLKAPQLTLANGGLISAATLGDGPAGSVTIDAGRIAVSGGASIETGTYSGATAVLSGAGGPLTVRATDSITIDGQGAIPLATGFLASTNGAGRGGDISVTAPALTVMNGGAVSSATVAAGPSGNVSVAVGRLELLSGSWIMSGSLGEGVAGAGGGNVTVTATESILVDGALPAPNALLNSAVFAATGGASPGGQVLVQAPQITLSNRGAIYGFTTGTGAAGAVTVNAGRLDVLSGGSIDSSGGGGAGGQVRISATAAINVSGTAPDPEGGTDRVPSAISADTSGRARGGDIAIETPRLTIAAGGMLRTTTQTFDPADAGPSGPAGSITIAAGSVELRDGAVISVQSADQQRPGGAVASGGPAGSITIDAGERLVLSGGSRINARTESAAAGDIRIRARELVYLSGSEISTSVAGGTGNGGNIFIDPVFVILDHSRIIANALAGNGGNISIVSEFFFNSGSIVQAASELGIAGTVQISSPNQNVNPATTALPGSYLDATSLLRESCAARAGRGGANSFTGAGRGGIAAAPEGPDTGFGVAPSAAGGARERLELLAAAGGCDR